MILGTLMNTSAAHFFSWSIAAEFNLKMTTICLLLVRFIEKIYRKIDNLKLPDESKSLK